MPGKEITAAACLLCGLVVLSTDALAQRTDRAFTATGRNCSDIVWQADVLQRYPDIDDACQEVVEYDGREYVRFVGTVQSSSTESMTMQFEGTDQEITLTTPDDLSLFVDGRPTRARRLQRGQELTFHVPADQFVAHFFEPGSETEFVVVRIVQAPAAQQVAAATPGRTLPQTASILPSIGLLGALLMLVGAVMLRMVPRR